MAQRDQGRDARARCQRMGLSSACLGSGTVGHNPSQSTEPSADAGCGDSQPPPEASEADCEMTPFVRGALPVYNGPSGCRSSCTLHWKVDFGSFELELKSKAKE